MKCKLCETRKPRRYCPGIAADICAVCCGNQREVTIDCPLDCPYLLEARTHEKRSPWDPATDPNKDVPLTEAFLGQHREALVYLGLTLMKAVGAEPAVDRDLGEALDALARTYRTMASGLYYESRPANPYANRIYDSVREAIGELQQELREQGKSSLRDAEVLGLVAFYGRVVRALDNGRPKGRAYIHELLKQFADMNALETANPREQAPSLIL